MSAKQSSVGAPDAHQLSSNVDQGWSDGRKDRRDKNRLAALDAALELFAENIDPSPEAVAARSGLSLRSIYRYFSDRDGLMLAAIERQNEVARPMLRIHGFGLGDLELRIDRFVHARMALYEAMGGTGRAARLWVYRNADIKNNLALTRDILHDQVAGQFAQEFAAMSRKSRNARLAAIDALCQFESIDNYRIHRAHTLAATRTMLIDALHDLLTITDS
ncbi:MAG: TetR/AcrR family transcriptional regulator [Actinomycetota bacterium]